MSDRRSRVANLPLFIVRVERTGTSPVRHRDRLAPPVHRRCGGRAKEAVARGLHGVKVKIGKPSAAEDAERLLAVRSAIGPDKDLMVDANQSMTVAEAIRRTPDLERAGVLWFEEPLPADDVAGHERLARSTTVPIAVGESMYSIGQFAEYLTRGAAGVVQADVARVGGITPWLKIAHLAEAHNVQVCPHFLMELHVSLCGAVPNSQYLEYIPQLRGITRTELTVEGGEALMPTAPGLGIDWDPDAIGDLRVAWSMTTTAPPTEQPDPAATEPATKISRPPWWANPRVGLVVVIAALVALFSTVRPAFLDVDLTLVPMQADISVFVVVAAQLAVLSLEHVNLAVGRMAAISHSARAPPLVAGLVVARLVGGAGRRPRRRRDHRHGRELIRRHPRPRLRPARPGRDPLRPVRPAVFTAPAGTATTRSTTTASGRYAVRRCP